MRNVLTGVIEVEYDKHKYRLFDRFATLSSIKSSCTERLYLRWPLVYISCVFGLESFKNNAARCIHEMIDDVNTYAKSQESGKDWELIVNVAIGLRGLDSSLNGEAFFNFIANNNASLKFDIQYIPSAYETLDDAYEYITKFATGRPNTLIQYLPTHHKFEVCDGLLTYYEA